MKALKKQGVAWTITAVMIVAAIAIGLGKHAAARQPEEPPSDQPPIAAAAYIRDDADVLSADAEDKLAGIIAGAIDGGGGVIAVVTCNYGKSDLYDYAMDRAGDLRLSGDDFIVVLDISGENYWLLQGSALTDDFTDQDCSDYAYNYMERDFARGDYDGAVLSLARALADWYADHF